MNWFTNGKSAGQLFRAHDGQPDRIDMLRSESGGPLRAQMLVTVELYIWVRLHRNGKRYDAMGAKAAPTRALLVSEGAGGAGGSAPAGPAAPIAAACTDVRLGGFRAADNGWSFADALGGDGGAMPRLTFAESDAIVADQLLEAKLWPAFGESGGEVAAVQIEFADGDGALQALRDVDSQILGALRAKPDLLGAGTTVDDVDDCFTPLVRDSDGRAPFVRFKNSQKRPTRFIALGANGEQTAHTKIMIPDGQCPYRASVLPTSAGISVMAKHDAGGRLESVTIKLDVQQAILSVGSADAHFDGMPRAPAVASDDGPVQDSKRIRLDEAQ